MNITITIPDGDENRVVGKIARYYGWTVDSRISKREFVKQLLVSKIREDLARAELQEVIESTPVSTDVPIT